ncbi:MAG TPA: class I SAM-dependent methyltransferase [Anaerolineales bacterium]|nr:class I SAM-dependent methyltransferase [Anaerolineales bacterium]
MPSSKIKSPLTGVSETLFIPLWARAAESLQPDPIISDPMAVDLLEKIDYDFDKFRYAWKTQLGIAIRTEIIDHAVVRYLGQQIRPIVVNLGAGLDTRYYRMCDAKVEWYELDLPEVMDFRRRFIVEGPHHKYIAKSMLDYTWMDEVLDKGVPVLIIAEGILMYLRETEVRTLFDKLVARFPGAEMILELIPYGAIGSRRYHDVLANFNVELTWSASDALELELWNPQIEMKEQWCILDYRRDHWKWLGLLADFPWIRLFFGERIVRLEFMHSSRKANHKIQ